MTKSNETKPGLLTTEFWVAAVLPWLIVVLQNADVVSVVPVKYRWVLPIAAMLVNGLYAQSRGRAKQGVPYNPTQ